jgi:hypothetical protein
MRAIIGNKTPPVGGLAGLSILLPLNSCHTLFSSLNFYFCLFVPEIQFVSNMANNYQQVSKPNYLPLFMKE